MLALSLRRKWGQSPRHLGINPTLESSKLNHPKENPRIRRPQVVWGFLLLLTTVIGDLGAASLQLGKSLVASIFIGLWIAQYVVLSLLIHSYITSRFMRILFGLMLRISISLLAMAIKWLKVSPYGPTYFS